MRVIGYQLIDEGIATLNFDDLVVLVDRDRERSVLKLVKEIAVRIAGLLILIGGVIFDFRAADVDLHLDAQNLLLDLPIVAFVLLWRPAEVKRHLLILCDVASLYFHGLLGIGLHLLIEGFFF